MGQPLLPEHLHHLAQLDRRIRFLEVIIGAQIARQLNRDDIPNVQYCLRKLEKMRLCRKVREKASKSFAYEVTAAGRALTDNYASMRRHLLTEQSTIIGQVDQKLAEATKLINLMTGLYDEAGRTSATYGAMYHSPETDKSAE